MLVSPRVIEALRLVNIEEGRNGSRVAGPTAIASASLLRRCGDLKTTSGHRSSSRVSRAQIRVGKAGFPGLSSLCHGRRLRNQIRDDELAALPCMQRLQLGRASDKPPVLALSARASAFAAMMFVSYAAIAAYGVRVDLTAHRLGRVVDYRRRCHLSVRSRPGASQHCGLRSFEPRDVMIAIYRSFLQAMHRLAHPGRSFAHRR